MQSQKKFQLTAAVLAAYALGTLALTLYLSQSVHTASQLALLSGSTKLPNMKSISDIPSRKQTFIDLLLPMIEEKNTALLQLRGEVLQMQRQLRTGQALTHVQLRRLERLKQRYQIDDDDNALSAEQSLDILNRRVDIIPPSMVLAQAAAESGWGTSRFAQQAQNLFGQWCYSKGCGIVPARRAAGARHEVRRFRGIEHALNAYYRNINSHRAYREVRQKRAELRKAETPVTGNALITGLTQYSSRGQAYVDELAELIRYNRLGELDD
ncbi:glucosaminidase domain-containing protein [Gilvimarinus algae]|uniref:Glucosaminidase domain-containing protein n=1 Tax=Gilvimarinus algae TaxID=3058037 RepID=A0ABT8TEG1_9GAMM|nr:glucosaminidase domain-containing protein [Gilvimarinus sp. SDUM040014]MDO3381056.1 glucosaminidase domain-containing protein [Gilvimarinus sp. SDUM040014]